MSSKLGLGRSRLGGVGGGLPAFITADEINERLGIGTATPGHTIDIVKTTSDPTSENAVTITDTKNTAIGGPSKGVLVTSNYEGVDGAAAVGIEGVRATVNFGGAGTPVAAIGTVHAGALNVVVRGSGGSENEHAALLGVVRYDIGTGFTQELGPAGRCWLMDLNVHGPIGVQPDLLSGINLFMNNYYNGVPLDQPSAAFAAVTFPGRGGGETATHTAATTYPLDVGFAVYGKSNTVAAPTGVGFKTGFQAGGTGSGWNASSLLERAFYGRDVTIEGLRLDTPGAGSPKGIVISGATWGTLIDLSGVTSPPAVGILMASNDLRWNTDGGGNIGAAGGVGRPQQIFVRSSGVNVDGVAILNVSSGGGMLEMAEQSADPAAPSANRGRAYMRDNGAGKTQYVVRFPTGAVQVIATEP